MSDPTKGPYFCHGEMEAIGLLELTGVATTEGTALWVCTKRGCLRWRHGYSWDESQLRAIVERHVPAFLQTLSKRRIQ